MADRVRPGSLSGFWRCGACGTPNPVRPFVIQCLGCGADRPRGAAQVEPAAAGATVVIRPRRGRRLWAVSWAYALLVVLALVLIHWVGDGWWSVTMLLLMPRWLFLVPLLLLVVASALARCPGHWLLQGATALVVAGPLMGLSLPFHRLWEATPQGLTVRLATLNMGLEPVRVDVLKRWVERERVDVLCFQEGLRDLPALRAFLAEGWHVSERRGVASRFPIVGELPQYSVAWDSEQRYSSMLERVRLRTPSGTEFVVATVHLPTLRWGMYQMLFRADASALRLHTAWWGREASRVLRALAETNDVPLLVGGDFNMPPDDSTLASLRRNYRFAFEEAGWGYGYTRPAQLPWLRIDHILASPDWSVTACRVGPDVGSDHLPMAAEFVLPAPAAPRHEPPPAPGRRGPG